MKHKLKNPYIIKPNKAPLSKPVAYCLGVLTIILALVAIIIEFTLFSHKMYSCMVIPTAVYIFIYKLFEKLFVLYKTEEFEFRHPSGTDPYLQFNYYDAISDYESGVVIYKITKIESLKKKGNDCILYCKEATMQNPPFKPKPVKKIRIKDVDDKVMEMIATITLDN